MSQRFYLWFNGETMWDNAFASAKAAGDKATSAAAMVTPNLPFCVVLSGNTT
ncbi:hypothetical protein J0671_25760 [Vibrio sp. Vb0592]|uniref:hypothetical protein n=1 Tax=Vibrio sp. Vb0592 TaxID=2816072 RepID=UPI001A8D2948|nr:hypothetical protein [Vibrio sp. Vb0592]MBO0246762.1 hypothetical protein [Vibrio sp. Vb0592]